VLTAPYYCPSFETYIAFKVFDVAHGGGLEEAEAFINNYPTLTSVGYHEAIQHWDHLHSHPKNTPELLVYYDTHLQNEFDKAYAPVLASKHPSRDIEWDEGKIALLVRAAFEKFGQWVACHNRDWGRRLGMSLRLYARLPIDEGKPDGPVFCPAAALPAKGWIEQVCHERNEYNFDDGLIIVSPAIST
jgi:hypothetical protein